MIRILLFVSAFLVALLVGSKLRQQGKIENENSEHEAYRDEETEHEREEKRNTGAMEFVNFHRGIRTRSDESAPSYPQGYLWTELQKGIALSEKNSSSVNARTQANGISSFIERGPGNLAGRIRGIIVDPDDATHKTWFVGSASGGIWKTIDAGISWRWITPNVPNLATPTLAMAPSNHQIIYAGTGEGFGAVDDVAGCGILLSTDKGKTWNLLPSTAAFSSINRLIVSETDPNYVVAASNSGIYLSTNQGSSWTKVYSGRVQDLRATPGNFLVQYATQNAIGVLKSIDGGRTWVRSNKGMNPTGRIEIAVSPSNTNYIAASAQGRRSGNHSDLYISTDAGANWTLVSLTINNVKLDYLGAQGWYSNTVSFNPYDENVIYVGGIGTYQVTLNPQQSNPRLSTVNAVNQPYPSDGYGTKNLFIHPDQHNVYLIPINSSTKTFQLLLANDGGVFISRQSTSPGTTQNEISSVGYGCNTTQFYGADKKPGAQEYLGGMQDNGTFFSPPGATPSAITSYQSRLLLSAGDGFEVLWHSQNGNYMIASSQYNTFIRSINGGNTWNYAFSGLPLGVGSSFPDANKFPFISKLASSKQAPDIIYSVGTQGVWKSIDFGANWALTPISLAAGWGLSGSFADVEVSRANANIVWAGAGQALGSNLFVSTDAGVSFSAVPNPSGLVLGNITRIATHPKEPKTAYAIFSFANTAKILRTKDLGQTWTDITNFRGGRSTNGFPDVAVYSLYVRPDNPNIIWAGTEIGIFESLDAGASWNLLTAFPSVAVWDMKGQDKEIVIATHGRGIWTAELSTNQNASFPPPTILATGTSPTSKFVVQASLPVQYDSVQIKIGAQSLTFTQPSGIHNVTISGVPKGDIPSVQLIGYMDSAPIYSAATSGYNLTVQASQQKYYDYFNSDANFYMNGFSCQSFGTANISLQSNHNYISNSDATATLLTPIIVASNGDTNITYEDVTIMIPTDSVCVEGSKDGVTWKPIAKAYNANAKTNSIQQTTLSHSQIGDATMQTVQILNLRNAFAANDTLLLRFRLRAASESTTAWGWSIDNLSIQESPTEVRPSIVNSFSVFPNPSPTGKFNVQVSLTKQSNISVSVWDVTGRIILNDNFGLQEEGEHQYPLNLEQNGLGVYIIELRTDYERKVMKVIKNSN